MQARQASLKINMVMNVILTLSSIIFPVITLPYVTRVLGAEGVGRVYFASSVIAGLAMFAEFGIPVYGIRACAKVRDDRRELSKTVREILTINLITCTAAYILLAVMLAAVPRLAAERTLLMIMSSTMLLSVSFKIIALIAMFVMVKGPDDYVIYGCITIFAVSASNIMNLCTLHRYADLRPMGRHDFAVHLPGMLMLFALAAATTVYTNLDLAILDFMRGDAEAGMYGVAVKVKLVIVSLVTSVSAVLLPRNSYYYEKNSRDEFYRLLNMTLKIVLMVSAPAAVYFMIYAGETISILAGAGFSGAVLPMVIIMPSVIFIGISNIIGIQMLVPSNREKTVVKAAVLGAITDLILNLILIPGYGSAGAAAATLAAEVIVTFYMIFEVRDSAAELFRDIPAGRIITALIISAAAGLVLKKLIDGPFLTLAVSAVCFYGLYALIIYCYELLHRN